MTPPPADDPDNGDEPRVDAAETHASGRADDAIEPPTRTAESSERVQPPAASEPAESVPPGSMAHHSPDTTDSAAKPTVEPTVGSNWWYAVAAVPLYVLVGIVGGVFAVVLFLFGIGIDVSGGMGIATGLVMVVVMFGVIGYTLAGLALSVLFPIGIYLDAKAVAASDSSWEPDAVLYLLVAAGSVVLSAFTLSAVLAGYYLYRRNQTVGVPWPGRSSQQP